MQAITHTQATMTACNSAGFANVCRACRCLVRMLSTEPSLSFVVNQHDCSWLSPDVHSCSRLIS